MGVTIKEFLEKCFIFLWRKSKKGEKIMKTGTVKAHTTIDMSKETTTLVNITEEKTKCSIDKILNYFFYMGVFGFGGSLVGRIVGGFGNQPLILTIIVLSLGVLGGFSFYAKRDK